MNGERDLVVGGGIAGIAAAVALSEAGREVCLLEKRAFLGGRASSFVDKETGEEIDNCQHVVLGCCTNVLDLFEKLGVRDQIEFSREFHYIEPDGRRHHLGPVNLPAPLHFLPGILSFGALSRGERFAIVCAFLRMMWTSDRGLRSLADCTVAEWLSRQRQPERAIRRFWDPILVSAVNESLDRAAALPCLQVFLEGFLPHRRAAAMGIPRIGLSQLYGEPARRFLEARGSTVRTRAKVNRIELDGNHARGVTLQDGTTLAANRVIVAVPLEATASIPVGGDGRLVEDEVLAGLEHSPITGIHLWYDREILDLPHAVLLDSTVQWVFRKSVDADARDRLGARQRLQLVISASADLRDRGRSEIVELATAELARAFPTARDARLVKSVVVKENRATFSSTPAFEALRPGNRTAFEGLFLAGDWTASGWPATLEGSTRSGRLAAAAAMGSNEPALVPDLPRSLIAKLAMLRVPRRWPAVSPPSN